MVPEAKSKTRLIELQRQVRLFNFCFRWIVTAFTFFVVYTTCALQYKLWHLPALVDYFIFSVALAGCLICMSQIKSKKRLIGNELTNLSKDDMELTNVLIDVLDTTYESAIRDDELKLRCIAHISRLLVNASEKSVGKITLRSRSRLYRILNNHAKLSQSDLTTDLATAIITFIGMRPDAKGLQALEVVCPQIGRRFKMSPRV
jgi:hypothetical protein